MLINYLIIVIMITAIVLLIERSHQLKQLRNLHQSLENKVKTYETKLHKLESDEDEETLARDHKPTYDVLTGLSDRCMLEWLLNRTLMQAKRYGDKLALLSINIDDFKLINDARGYDTGDKVLQIAAKRIQAGVRQVDTISRYAGDTFIVLLPRLLTVDTASLVAQRLLDSVVQPCQVGEHSILITVSIGIAIYPTDGISAELLLKHADTAMRLAKTNGKNKYQFFQPDLYMLSPREVSMAKLLQQSNFLDSLAIKYEQYINIKLNCVEGMGAFLELLHPEYGTLPFSDFAHAAESTNRIIDMSTWLLKNAIQQYFTAQKAQPTIRQLIMRMNIQQLENAQFIEQVSSVLAATQIDPKQIIIEIAEDYFAAEQTKLEGALSVLQRLNINVALNIYTVGYLALQKIEKLPINYLIINEKLLHSLSTNKGNEHLVETMVTIADTMKIHIIAESVETEQQKAMLVNVGCNIMQGKLFKNVAVL